MWFEYPSGKPRRSSPKSKGLFDIRQIISLFFISFFFLYCFGFYYFVFQPSKLLYTDSNEANSNPSSSSQLLIKKIDSPILPLPPFHRTTPLHFVLQFPAWWFYAKVLTHSQHFNSNNNPPFAPTTLPEHYKSYIEKHAIETQGVILLGMHHSNTSLLSGLLTEGLKIDVGPKNLLLQPPAKGEQTGKVVFYETLLSMVLQNDDIMTSQSRDYGNVDKYDIKQSILTAFEFGTQLDYAGNSIDTNTFGYGEESLKLYGGFATWLQVDPRMCITLPTYFPFLRKPPAVIYTYRNPLEVARSMFIAEPGVFTISRLLKLWVIYNKDAMINSEGLCRVYTNADRVNYDAYNEVVRIGNELKDMCGVSVPALSDEGFLEKSSVEAFIDHNVDHKPISKPKLTQATTTLGLRSCKWRKYETKLKLHNGQLKGSRKAVEIENEFYNLAMQVHCDLESGHIIKVGERFYDWGL